MKISKILWAGLVAAVLVAPVNAKTPDGATPSVETICDVFRGGKRGAFGLCNAFCEAMDCGDPNQHAANPACTRVNDNFEKKFGVRLPEALNFDDEGNLINTCVLGDDDGDG